MSQLFLRADAVDLTEDDAVAERIEPQRAARRPDEGTNTCRPEVSWGEPVAHKPMMMPPTAVPPNSLTRPKEYNAPALLAAAPSMAGKTRDGGDGGGGSSGGGCGGGGGGGDGGGGAGAGAGAAAATPAAEPAALAPPAQAAAAAAAASGSGDAGAARGLCCALVHLPLARRNSCCC